MAEQYVKLVPANRHTDWTAEVVLEKDDDGVVTRSVKVGEPVQLSVKDRETVEGLGYTVEDSSKSEAEQVAEVSNTSVGADTSVTGPVFGDSEEPNQATGFRSSESNKNDKK